MARIINPKEDFVKFLGTAGARFVMIEQLRASGGIWISYKGTNLLVDPGPGSIVRCSAAKPKLNPSTLDGIILTHKHLDHANDINVMIEAMTEGGFKKRGRVFCPADAINKDSIILKYARNLPAKIEILKAKHNYSLEGIPFETSMKHLHAAETYGLKFKFGKTNLAILADTRYFKELADFYKVDILVIFVVFFKPRPGIDHLSLVDVEKFIKIVRPKKVILTHFGISMLNAKPNLQAKILSKNTGVEVEAAYDGMTLSL